MNQITAIEREERKDYLPQPMYVDAFYRIYNKVNETGKETSKSYQDNLLICFGDIQELHQKIHQTISSQGVKEYTLKINMEQAEGEEHTFNNFEDFSKHNITSPYVTQEIYFYYKFIIYNEEQNKFENYSVSFKISSRIAAFENIRKDSPYFLLEIMAPMRTVVALVNVEYYDYVKARSFVATFDEWVKGCSVYTPSIWLVIAKKIAPNLPRFGTFFMLVIFTFLTISSVPDKIDSISVVTKFLMFYISAFSIFGKVIKYLLGYISKRLNENIPLSYVKINKGDNKLIEEYEKQVKNNLLKSFLGLVVTILLGVSINFIYDLAKVLFFPIR